MPEIAALREVNGERRTLDRRARPQCRKSRSRPRALGRIGSIWTRPPAKLYAANSHTGTDVRDRCRERVRGIVVLMPAFKRRDPNHLRPAGRRAPRRTSERGAIKVGPEAARRRLSKPDNFEPEQSRAAERLRLPPPNPFPIARPLPRPKQAPGRHAGCQMQHEHAGAGGDSARRGNAAGDDLVIGMRRQDQNAARARVHRRAGPRACAAPRHTGSRSCSRTSPQFGTRAST